MHGRPIPSLVVALALVGPSAALASPDFVDVTAAAGLGGFVQHVQNPPASCIMGPNSCQERMTGGVAVGDYDGDGDPDVYVTILDGPDELFQNQGNGTFVDAAAAAGLAAFDLQSNGAAFADLDNDGDADLYVTTLGAAGDPVNDRHYLFVNQGNGTFVEDAVARGAAIASSATRQGWSIAVGDYDRDGWLDLFVGEWRKDDPGGSPSHARLLRNLGPGQPGHFADVTAAAGVDLDGILVFPEGVWAFAPAFVDLDGDFWPDLAIASDFGSSRLFWNQGDGSFLDGTAFSRVGTDENGMGSTFGDVDGDGDLDWFVTSIHDPAETCESPLIGCIWGYSGNRLYRQDFGRRFSDATDDRGVRAGYWGWGAAFFDWDQDADLDLVMTNGVDFPGTDDDAFTLDPMRLWRNDGPGAMAEVSAAEGVTDTGSGKGLVTLDYDGDGDEDVLVVNNAAAPVLYENRATGGDWLRVRAQGVAVNRDGIGARVRVTTLAGGASQLRVIGVGSHYMGHGEPVAHFGLGAPGGPVHEVRVEWPNSRVSVLSGVARNQTLTVVEPATDVCDDGFDNDGDGLVDHGADPGCDSPTDAWETSPALVCDNGLEDDGDGFRDAADPGCSGPTDATETNPAFVCDDGVDNDADGATDYPADPGCAVPMGALENPACQDGIDNDLFFGTDFDGGAFLNGGLAFDLPDPQCWGRPHHNREHIPSSCGLGWELAPLLALGLVPWRRGASARRFRRLG